MTCPACGRKVLPAHADCGGDPRATCCIYGCGLPKAVGTFEQLEGTGHTTWLSWCDRHKEGA